MSTLTFVHHHPTPPPPETPEKQTDIAKMCTTTRAVFPPLAKTRWVQIGCVENGAPGSLKRGVGLVHISLSLSLSFSFFTGSNNPMEDAFWCGHAPVTLEQFCYYPSVYDLQWSHDYREVIHIHNHFLFYFAFCPQTVWPH